MLSPLIPVREGNDVVARPASTLTIGDMLGVMLGALSRSTDPSVSAVLDASMRVLREQLGGHSGDLWLADRASRSSWLYMTFASRQTHSVVDGANSRQAPFSSGSAP